MKVGNIVPATLSSVLFLSRLPLGRLAGDEMPAFRETAFAFPLAGLIIALPASIILYVLSVLGLASYVVALVTISALVITTGALHEDGLADVADGFWGGQSRERKLEIMRDSSIGTYGALALILSVGLRVALLAQVLERVGPFGSVLVLLAVASCSRLAMLWPWTQLEPARPAASETSSNPVDENVSGKLSTGLSVRYGIPTKETYLSTILCALPAIALILMTIGIVPSVAALIAALLCTVSVSALAKRHIGGQTGDVLGATQQLSELGLYLGLLIAI